MPTDRGRCAIRARALRARRLSARRGGRGVLATPIDAWGDASPLHQKKEKIENSTEKKKSKKTRESKKTKEKKKTI